VIAGPELTLSLTSSECSLPPVPHVTSVRVKFAINREDNSRLVCPLASDQGLLAVDIVTTRPGDSVPVIADGPAASF
jgi:hypothetical protein